MSQTGRIFGALLVGFLVYVTLLGHLPQYFALLWTKGQTSAAPVNPASSGLQTAPSSVLPGIQNPYMPNPDVPLQPGISPPETGGGFGQF